MLNQKVLILGCGAVSLLQGYYLNAGADVTYPVRSGRKLTAASPKHLSTECRLLYVVRHYWFGHKRIRRPHHVHPRACFPQLVR